MLLWLMWRGPRTPLRITPMALMEGGDADQSRTNAACASAATGEAKDAAANHADGADDGGGLREAID